MHIYSLASCLIQQGHKVIVITHSYECDSNKNNNRHGKDNEHGKDNGKGDGNGKRTGVRYLPGPLKVYYCPFLPMVDQDCLPTFSTTFPLLRHIWIREQIQIVHAHQATSTLANESMVYASEMGLASVYTDHSLFGINDDLASVILNKVLMATLCNAHAIICVSHTCRENFIMRTRTDPSIVHAIPNAIDADKFTPINTGISNTISDSHNDRDMESHNDTSCSDNSTGVTGSSNVKDRIKIVVISRLVYRKGVDLLVGIIPAICHMHPHVDFIIGGDGPKKLILDQMVERERLQDRVEFLGSVPHVKVRDILTRGHFFLNCSLTESFCIAILEAASCGLFVVSTRVGGVPEVLPSDMIRMGEANVEDMTRVLKEAIEEKIVIEVKKVKRKRKEVVVGLQSGPESEYISESKQEIVVISSTFDPVKAHERIRGMYSWHNVATKTVDVYRHILEKNKKGKESWSVSSSTLFSSSSASPSCGLLQRLARYKSVGPLAGYIVCMIAISLHLFVKCIDWWQPRELIDVVPDLKPDPFVRERDTETHAMPCHAMREKGFFFKKTACTAPTAARKRADDDGKK